MRKRRAKTYDDFWNQLDRTGDCWLWTRTIDRHGYGQVWDGTRTRYTHRVAWELTHGPIPKGAGALQPCVCHRCDNRRCCRPDHLFLGTHRDNITDMREKGRARFNFHVTPYIGATNAKTKLTPDNVRDIRRRYAAGESQATLARDFGVVFTTISALVTGRTWRHIS